MMSGMEKTVLNELLSAPGIAEVIGKSLASKLELRTNERIKTIEEVERLESELTAKQSELEKAKTALQQAQQQANKMIDGAAIAARKIEQECCALSSKLHRATTILNREHREGDTRTTVRRLEAEIQNCRARAEALGKSLAKINPVMPFQYALNPQQRAEKKHHLEKCEQQITALKAMLTEVKKLQRARVSPDYITEALAAATLVIEGG